MKLLVNICVGRPTGINNIFIFYINKKEWWFKNEFTDGY